MFKNWKSVFSIHTLQKMKEQRYITMLYMRLILIIVNLQIINQAQGLLYRNEDKESILSYRKTLQTLKNSFSEIMLIILTYLFVYHKNNLYLCKRVITKKARQFQHKNNLA